VSAKRTISFIVNGTPKTIETYPLTRLLDVLRNDLKLTGTKEGCGEGECGACAVIVNDELVNSCLVPIMQVDGARICTIEELSKHGDLHPMQAAFIDTGGAQCGICTPGMIMASIALLQRNSSPTLEEIREGLAGNLCRCTGYMRIFEAVQRASSEEP
jgi:carbon-monoxide dehydrogenase small subunit